MESFGEVWRGLERFLEWKCSFLEWWSSFREWSSSFVEVWRVFRTGRVRLESVKVMPHHECWSFREFWRGLKSFPEWSSSFGEWSSSFDEFCRGLERFGEVWGVGGGGIEKALVYFLSENNVWRGLERRFAEVWRVEK